MYFLDTNTCVYFLNGKYPGLRDRLLSIPPGEIAIPSVVKAELLLGVYKSFRKEENLQKVEAFLDPFEIVPFGDSSSYLYANIRAETERRGEPLGRMIF